MWLTPGGDGFAQHGQSGVLVARRSKDSWTGQLHRAVTNPFHGQGGTGKSEVAAEFHRSIAAGNICGFHVDG